MQSVYHRLRVLAGHAWVVASVVAIAAFALYASVIGHGFVADDFIFLHQLRFKQPELADSFVYFGRDWGMGVDFYRPLTRIYWALLHAMWNESAWGWHLAGAILYSATAALVAILALRLSGQAGVAVLAGLFFAAHPAHAETGSWVANSSDLLAGLFCLLATLYYITGYYITGRQQYRLYLLSAICFFAALLSKESSAGFILVPVAYDLIFGFGRGRRGDAKAVPFRNHFREIGWALVRQLPFVLALLTYIMLRWSALGGIGGYASAPGDRISLGTLIEVYPRWLLMPINLSDTLLWLLFAATVAGLAAIVVYWERRDARHSPHNDKPDHNVAPTYRLLRTGVFGLVWLLLYLLPTITTPPSIRFVYLSTVGVALLGGVLLSPILRSIWVASRGVPLARPYGEGAISKRQLQALKAASWLKLAMACALLFLSVGDALSHLDAWHRAGQSARDIFRQIREARPQPEKYTPVYAAGLPEANEEALIFRTGFPEAIQLLYDDVTVEGIPVQTFPVVELGLNEAYFVEYRDERIITRDDLVADLQERNKQVKAKAEQPYLIWNFSATVGETMGWQIIAGEGNFEALRGGLEVSLPGGGFVRPPHFSLEAPALARFELEAKGIPADPAQASAQLVVHWLVQTPQGPSERASAPLPIALDGESHTYRIKPLNMLPFALYDSVSEIRIELPPGIANLTITQARLYKLPWR